MQVHRAIQALQHKQAQGLNQANDPEFAHLVRFVQQHTAQQPLAQPQPPPPQSSQAAAAAPQQQQVAPAMTKPMHDQLNAQIHAYRHIARSLPVPDHLAPALTTAAPGPSIPSSPTPNPNPNPVARAVASATAASVLQPGTKIATVDPFAVVARMAFAASPGGNAGHRLLVPSVTPPGIDPIALQEEMDRRIMLSVSLPDGVAPDSPQAEELANVKLKALIELKSLKLLDKQQRLRDEMLLGLRRSSILFTGPNRNAFKRVKAHVAREPRLTEQLEHRQKLERENKEKAKHSVFLQAVIAHGSKLTTYHARQRDRWAKIGKSVQSMHAKMEKEEKERRQRVAAERLRALREGDEAAYLKLVDQAKDTRITHLLRQTDQFLAGLVAGLMVQKDSIRRTNVDSHPEAGAAGVVDDDDKYVTTQDGQKLDYYAAAHSRSERIERQAGILTGGKLKDYQVRGLEWMVSLYNNRLNGILADEMGLGKTIQTISLITYLIEAKTEPGPYLVIFAKWAPSVKTIIFKGPPVARKAQAAHIKGGGFNVVLTTFEYIIREKNVLGRVNWLYTIIDEGHRMKNAESKLSVTLNQNYSSKYRLILTGTPLQNNLPELWALLNFILPQVFNSQSSFDEWFSAPFADSTGGEEKLALTEEEQLLVIKRLHKVLRPFLLRRLKKDVESELPDKVERIVKTKMSGLQKVLYDQVRNYGAIAAGFNEEGKRAAGIKSLNNTVMQLRKICNHPYTFPSIEIALGEGDNVTPTIVRSSGKFELLDRVLPKLFATGHRVLMFFQMTEVMKIFSDYLNWRKWKHLLLDGSTKTEDRQEQLKVFNAPTRTCTYTVIIFDSDWNPHQDLQAQDRAHRIGQTKEVRILRLITEHSIEERILARAQQKLDMDGKVIQAGKFDNKTTAEEREQLLRSLLEQDSEDKNNDDEEELTDEELNELLARTDDEMIVFKRMDAELAREEALLARQMGWDKPQERLIQESELPYSITRDVGSIFKRSRRAVVYDDGLTEAEYVAKIEALEDERAGITPSAAAPTPGRRGRKSAAAAAQKLKATAAAAASAVAGATVPSDSEMAVAGADPNAIPGPKKRGRKKKAVVEDAPPSKRARLTAASETASAAGSLGMLDNNPIAAGATPQEQALDSTMQTAYAIMRRVMFAIADLVDVDDDNRSRAYLFLELPSREDYPTYYLEIAHPISLLEIGTKVQSLGYGTESGRRVLEAFAADVQLMCTNARRFNQEGSMVYNDADVIEAAALQRLAELSRALEEDAQGQVQSQDGAFIGDVDMDDG
ncbi:SNF2 family N-terminal domain-domain-containing protein [Catenaria anguillulae PL171]|uniref:SNF2 family N-terminal domain-domain-containing protein n=1 Tax=Catenaria anguillulae PL171 TaxID=765915 RepID=A0A1Y2HQM2_9FUNG|nr:SNF2 family N-terminal domain-domain-containing protein [Catenaria anguillulae PL171]